jgi:hypothetical protein
MKSVSLPAAVAVLVLIALTFVPAVGGFRAGLSGSAFVAAVVLLASLVAGDKRATKPQLASIEPIKSASAPIARNQAEADVIGFLAALQQKGRLVDFLMEDVTAYSDAQVGAVARTVHEGCKVVLREQFAIVPVRDESEGAAVTVPAGYQADEYRLVGKISGQAPFLGTLMHRGWRTESVKLPRLLRTGDDRLPTIAPAEVELK